MLLVRTALVGRGDWLLVVLTDVDSSNGSERKAWISVRTVVLL